MNFYSYLQSPIGKLLLLSEGSFLTGLYMDTGRDQLGCEDQLNEDLPVLQKARQQLHAYFERSLQEFDLPLKLIGTEFQRSVWSALQTIPYGTVTSYGQLARMIGNEKAVRAVGLANGKNPISIIVPCHRVIGSNGTLTGYGGGLPRKEFLLNLERGQSQIQASISEPESSLLTVV